jgi:hypothetical protein
MVRSNHTSHQMIVDNPKLGCEIINIGAYDASHVNKVVANSDLDDAAMIKCDNHSAIVTSTPFSPEIPKSDDGAILNGERQYHLSLQGDSIASPSGKRSRSLSGSDQADGRGSDWVFDVFVQDDNGTEGDYSLSSKRVQSSSCPLEATENRTSPAVAMKDVQMSGSVDDDRPPQGDHEYKVNQVVDKSGLEYEVTAFMKLWLPKASVDPKLVRKYLAERRVATRVRTRWSSRLRDRK